MNNNVEVNSRIGSYRRIALWIGTLVLISLASISNTNWTLQGGWIGSALTLALAWYFDRRIQNKRAVLDQGLEVDKGTSTHDRRANDITAALCALLALAHAFNFTGR
jgi:hypothetical protein